MKFGKTAIPTPPKGFQAIFQLWLVQYEVDTNGMRHFLLEPDDHLFQDDVFYLDDKGKIHVISNGQHITLNYKVDWDLYTTKRIKAFEEQSGDKIFFLDDATIALEIPDIPNTGIRWFVFSNPEIVLLVLAKTKKLGRVQRKTFMALFEHFFNEKLSIFKAMLSQEKELEDACKEHVLLMQDEDNE